jgi:murein DD-endopeptidase MepM/ murein hydrolase activator NlpD
VKLIGKLLKSHRLFTGISWGVTVLIVAALLGFAIWHVFPQPVSAAPAPSYAPTEEEQLNSLPAVAVDNDVQAIVRHLALKTVMDQAVDYKVQQYKVQRGDSVYGIASQFNLKPETVFWANANIFQGSPDNIKSGQLLNIPPIDGIYYEWQQDDTFESVAEKFGVEPDVIVSWPGNDLDLSNPIATPGQYVMIPGGVDNSQPLFISTYTIASSAVASTTNCGGGYAARNFFGWPTTNHFLSGYGFGDNNGTHRGIDISAPDGSPIYAADNGVVSFVSGDGSWDNGFGNMIQIDHMNGFVTLYAHLSSVMVSVCDSVPAGSLIGYSGSTGNSSGAHLHFEIRLNGVPVNPWDYLP